MQEDKGMLPQPASEEEQHNRKLIEPAVDLPGSLLAGAMPHSYIDRWLLYLEEIDGGALPVQASYHCWCEDCWQAEQAGRKDFYEPEVPAANTAEVRSFIQRHEGHDVTLMMEHEQEYADLEQRAKTILLRDAIYRRHWVAQMSDKALLELPLVGPKLFTNIRKQIPYMGSPQENSSSPQWERCPTCYGTGLKLTDAALTAAVQRVNDLEEATGVGAGSALQPVPSVEESLMHITSAIQEINSRLAVLEKDRKEGLTTPRILMSHDAAAKAVGVRPSVIWDAIMEGDIPFVRMVKGLPMVRSEALQEWLKWREKRIEPEPEPYVYVIRPERLCQTCGEREYDHHSRQLKLCRECHQQVKQARMEEKERKRAERLLRKEHSGQP